MAESRPPMSETICKVLEQTVKLTPEEIDASPELRQIFSMGASFKPKLLPSEAAKVKPRVSLADMIKARMAKP